MAWSHRPLRAGAAVALFAAAAGIAAVVARAAEPGYQIQLGVTESDNIQRLPNGGSDATVGYEELGFTWHEKRPSLDADIDADVSHLNYFQHTYSDEVIGNFIGEARLKLAPQVFSWEIFDNFGQTRLDPLLPITPGNRENINYFGTGPELSVPLSRDTQLNVNGQYGRVDYETSPLDSNRVTGGIGLQHLLSPLSSVSLNVKEERINFSEDQLNPDYSRQEAFARFDSLGSRTQLGVELGYSRIQQSGASSGSLLARLDLSRKISASSTIGLGLGHQYSDGADSFRLVQSLGGATLNTQTTVPSGTPFVSDYATLGWNFQHVRTTMELSGSYFRDRYQTLGGQSFAELDNDRAVLDGRVTRRISPVIDLALTEYVIHQRYISTDERSTETNTGLQLTWRAGRNLSVFLAYYLAKSSSDISANDYTENRIWLSIGYGRAAQVPPGPEPVRMPGRL